MVKSGGQTWLLTMEEPLGGEGGGAAPLAAAAHHRVQQNGAPRSQNRVTASLADRIRLFRTACLSALRRTSFAASVPQMVVQLGGIPAYLPQKREENEQEKKTGGSAQRRGVHGAEDDRAVARECTPTRSSSPECRKPSRSHSRSS